MRGGKKGRKKYVSCVVREKRELPTKKKKKKGERMKNWVRVFFVPPKCGKLL